jgi:hypothetical protein
MVTIKEYWDFTSEVADLLIDMATEDPTRWTGLIERLSDFPPPSREKAYGRLQDLASASAIPSETRTSIWTNLDALVRHHRAFPNASWSLPSEDLERISAIANVFQPEDPVLTTRWLFDDDLPDLGPERENFDQRQREIMEARRAAITKVYLAGGLSTVNRLAESSEYPWFVGISLADSDLAIRDEEVLELLDHEGVKKATFAFAFAFRRAQTRGWDWLDAHLQIPTGRPVAQARLLRASPMLPLAWERAEALGAEVDQSYWDEFTIEGRGPGFPYVNETGERLLAHGRPGTALDLLHLYLRRGEEEPPPELLIRAFEALLGQPSDDPELRRLSSYEIEQLLDYLRSAHVDDDRLAILEWRLLPVMRFDGTSPVLERRLSKDPSFFVEILSLCFRPKNREAAEQATPAHVAANAFRLLREWKIVPGSEERGGEVDESALRQWIAATRDLLQKADRIEIGDEYIGQVFAHSPGDANGTWPTLPVRNVIEGLGSEAVEDGLVVGIFNKRGVTTRGLAEGGQQERELASQFRELAALIADGWPRTAAALRSVAEGYASEGRLHDERRDKLGS